MKTYILLANIAIDASGGEYGLTFVSDIYLGYGDFVSDEDALKQAEILNKEIHKDNYEWKKYESNVKFKKLD